MSDRTDLTPDLPHAPERSLPARGTAILDALVRDARYGARRLARDWLFTLAAVALLGLGIGANTAIFSLVNAALLRQQPLANPDRLVDIFQNASNPGGMDGNSYPAYLDMAEYKDVFSSTTAVLVPLNVTYQEEGALRPAVVEHTTATYPSVLDIRPSLGRWFSDVEDRRGASVVAVLGHQAWTRKFHADPSVIGRTIRIGGVPVTIVGVGPVGHNSTFDIGLVTDFWLPVASLPARGAPPAVLERHPPEAAFFVKARLRDGVTVAQAQAAMDILGARLAAEYPKEDPGRGITVYAARDVRVHPQLDVVLRWLASILLAVVGLVLAIACSNLSTLVLVRGAARAKEVSVRLALCATRGQLVRHLLVENLLLSAAGGLGGCLLAWWAIRLIGTVDLPVVVDVSLDYRVLLFVVGLSLVTGLAVGLAPALGAARIDLVSTLRDDREGVRRLTLKGALVAFQVAVSVVLLGGTSVFLQMLDASRVRRVSFAVDGVAILETDTRYGDYAAPQAEAVCEELRLRIAALPGVQAAVLSRGLPMEATSVPLVIEGAAAEATLVAGGIWAGPGFFEMLRIPILYGRAIDERDRRDAPRVAVISETLARQYFGAVDAVGRRFRLEREADGWIEVVGVARDTGTADLQGDLIDPTPQLLYRSFTQWDLAPTTVIARTSLDAADLLGDMQRELRAVDASLPIVSARTMAGYLDESLVGARAVAMALGGLGALGLGLSGIGLYAVIAFAVARRSREIGIRLALGVRSGQIVGTVARDVAVLVGVGTGGGLALSLLAILGLRAVAAPAPGIALYRPTVDPVALLSIIVLMAAVALAAGALPAWRAARLDPLTTLRRE